MTDSDSPAAAWTDVPKVAVGPDGLRDYLGDVIIAAGANFTNVSDADALVWADPSDVDGLRAALEINPGLRWVQLPFAGVDKMIGLIDRDRVWTSAKGVYGDPVAEHALGLAIAGMRNIASFARITHWDRPRGRSLFGANVTILGAGGLAISLARVLEPFNVSLTVLRRKSEPFPGAKFTGTLDDLDDVLPDTDVLFITVPLTPATTGLIDARRLALMSDHSWLINIGRGRHVVTDDLVAALEAKSIGGAALDVTDPEPLPEGHPLWSLDNCIITPHSANTPAMSVVPFSKRVTDNVQRFARGEELLGIVDLDAGF